MARPRLVFMGTPAFAVPSFLACFEVGEVVACVTQPDRPKGRGQAMAISPVKEAALARGVPLLQPPKLKTPPFSEVLAGFQPDACVVAAYGRILPKDLLAVPARGCFNVHGSLLPRWRGAAPIQWALASGDARTGVCLMQMEEGLDTGPVFACRELPLLPEDTSETVFTQLAELGGALLREELPAVLAGERVATPQPAEGVTLAPPISKEQGRLDFNRDAVELERQVRAFFPWPGTFTWLGGERLKVQRARVGAGSGPPGEVLRAGPELEVACGVGSLLLLEVQAEGKRRMMAREFLAGRPLPVGSRPFGGERGGSA